MVSDFLFINLFERYKYQLIYFIVNPAAGSGKAEAAVPTIEKVVRGSNIDYSILRTAKPGDVERISGLIDFGAAGAIICVGGDGTVCEYAGLAIEHDIKYGVIPAGSANDMLLAIPGADISTEKFRSFEDKISYYAKKALFGGDTVFIDAISINRNKYFLNIGGTGIEIQVLKDAIPLKKYFGGAAYFFSLMKNAITYKAGEMTVTVDGEAEKDVFLSIAVCNGSHYGGKMRIAPPAVINDGKITLCKIKKMPKLKLATLFPAVKPGWHTHFKEVSYINCESVTLEYEGSKTINLDGNLIEYESPLTFEILAGAVEFIV